MVSNCVVLVHDVVHRYGAVPETLLWALPVTTAEDGVPITDVYERPGRPDRLRIASPSPSMAAGPPRTVQRTSTGAAYLAYPLFIGRLSGDNRDMALACVPNKAEY